MESPSLKRKVFGSILSAALISYLFTPVGHAEEEEQAKGQKEKISQCGLKCGETSLTMERLILRNGRLI